MPFEVVVAHVHRTDCAAHVEAQWHKYFAPKRVNGEWFALSDEDVALFRSSALPPKDERMTTMGLFEAASSSNRPLCPAGTHYATLKSVEVKPMPSYEDPNVMTPRAMFVYETTSKDPETGLPYELADFTGTKYGNEKAKLTMRLDSMFPALNPEQRAALNPSDLENKRFVLEVVHKKKSDGNVRADIAFIKPFLGKTPPAPQPQAADDNEDPFADE